MPKEKRSPEISKLKWGTVEVQQNKKYKDAKLFPGGSRKWDWNETGTSHVPGIQPADIEELLDHDVDVIVLSRGINRRLQVKQDTLDILNQKEIEYHVLQTEEAVKKYNELREDRRVGALIHSTC
ncbi:Mth938-like domain-containing protein [Aliifodinibius sp. S!AR15-10]|uniref:Mth938-like domain-containing protein n=1 Tax=Aliifodinibius sp. S!AR15-10 TaxID=2950437 RepID=UPI00286701D2|nr:Mth938-like domain-containing protein [Aliifodinibius sp. S!AR15-10]MDR8392357.1 Mth938-like domain-containing protein [Aliifodinibius sp. S!AR15-10]